jgi:hypothetical protein
MLIRKRFVPFVNILQILCRCWCCHQQPFDLIHYAGRLVGDNTNKGEKKTKVTEIYIDVN